MKADGCSVLVEIPRLKKKDLKADAVISVFTVDEILEGEAGSPKNYRRVSASYSKLHFKINFIVRVFKQQNKISDCSYFSLNWRT